MSAWSAKAIGGGDLSVSAASALIGANGLQAVINDNVAMYVADDRPNAEPRYRVRFYFDPNGIVMSNGDAHYLFYGYQGTTQVVLRVEFRRYNNSYQVRAALLNDAATWRTTNYATINDAPYLIELDWRAATAPGANNGSLTFWVNEVQIANLGAVDNDTRRIDRVRAGPVAGLDAGTRGVYFFDAFEARRVNYIGSLGSRLSAEPKIQPLIATTLATTTLQAGSSSRLQATVAGLAIEANFSADSTNAITGLLGITDTNSLPDGYTLLGEAITVQTQSQNLVAALAQPVTVTVHYGALNSGLSVTELTLQQANSATEQWDALPATLDTVNNTITASVYPPATFALLGKEAVAEGEESGAFTLYLPTVQR